MAYKRNFTNRGGEMSNEIATKEHYMPELNADIIKKYICPAATEQEIYIFLQLCKAQRLNPFLREAYLVKYGNSPATIVTGKETFTKRAASLPDFSGFKAGIIVLSGDKIVYREGAFYTSSESVMGGWAEVYVKGRAVPYRNEVSVEEYEGKKADGSPTKMWAEKRGTMIRKVALVQSLREGFPDAFGGLYSPEEINTVGELPNYEMGKAPVVQPPTQVTMPRSKSAAAPVALTTSSAPDGIEIMLGIADVTVSKGEKDGKPWTKYHIKDTSGGSWTTFDKKIADTAKAAKETGEAVSIKTETKGKYTNLISMSIVSVEETEQIEDLEREAEFSKIAEEAAKGLNL